MKSLLARSLASAILMASISRPMAAQAPNQDNGTALSGRWLMEVRQRKLVVEITTCGAAALCGTIIRDMPETDGQNQAAASEPEHPVVGWKLLKDFTKSDDGNWHGQMVNFMNGRPYKCVMRLDAPGRLRVRPYMGIPALGITHIWPRYEEDKKQGLEN